MINKFNRILFKFSKNIECEDKGKYTRKNKKMKNSHLKE